MRSPWIIFSVMGIELVGIILACIYIGVQLEKTYELGGLGIAGLSMVGLAGWLIHMVYLYQRIQARETKELTKGS